VTYGMLSICYMLLHAKNQRFMLYACFVAVYQMITVNCNLRILLMLQMYDKTNVLQKPESVFVVTELKIAAYPLASIYIACNARGTALAPFVIFHNDPVDGARLAACSLAEFKDALFFNAKGSQDGDALFVWLRDHFMQCKTSESVILFVGCPVSAVSLRFVQLAEEEHVSLVSVPSTIAHLVQPLTSGILHSLNSAISSGVEQLVSDGRLEPDSGVTRSLLAVVLSEVWADQWPCRDVSEAFESCGIFPLNVRAITAERIAAALTSDNGTESFTENESEDEQVTHGLNLLSELSTMEQRNEGCTDDSQNHFKNVNFSDGEIVTDTSAVTRRRTPVACCREMNRCFVSELGAKTSDTPSSSVFCQQHSRTEIKSPNDCDQFGDMESKHNVRLISTGDRVTLAHNTANRTCTVHSRHVMSCDCCENSSSLNSRQKNVNEAVGRKVFNRKLARMCIGVETPALNDTACRLSEQSVFL